MSISHRTNRLKLVGQPSVEQLQNGRYRLTVTCSTINSREDWYSANKDRIFPDFGSLQSAEMSIDGLAPREGEAYTDMRLTKVESGNRSGMGAVGDYNVELTYETLGSAFVQVKDDTTDYELNGLRRVTRTSIAEDGTDYAETVGSSYIDHQINSETAVRCYLASYSVDDTDSFRQVQEVYIEPGILSETLDNVGSQKAKVIETIGADPATPADYSLASKQESDFEGFQTNRFTFLKNDVQLSKSEDEVGSQNAITEQWFKPAAGRDTKTSYSLARKEESDVDGIPTERYTFLKNDVLLSESEDKVGSQKAIIEEWFNPDPANTRNVKTNYSLAREEISDISGIPTVKYTFLKPSVLSRDLQISKGGTIQTETVETFEIIPLTSLVAGADESIITISRDESNYEGIKTLRYVFVLADGQTRIRTRSGPPELAGSTIKTIVSVGTEAVESATGELIESIDELADGFSIFTREYLMPFDNETPLTGLKRTYSDSIKVRVPGAIQLQVVNVSIETVTGQEATVLDTPPSTQTISVDVEVSIETTDPSRTVPPFDMGKIRCSLSMERMTHSYRGFQSYTSSIPPVIDEATQEVITRGETITNYYPKQSVSSSASVRVYPERYLIGSDSLTAELKYQSQLNRAQQVGGGVPLSNTPLYDTKQVNMRVTGSTAPKGYSTSGTIKTDSRPIITTADGVTYYEVVRWKTNGTSSVEFPIAQAGSSGSTSSLGVPQLPDNPTVYGAEDAPLYTEGGMSLSPSLYGSFLG